VLPLLPAAATTPIDLIHAADAAEALARLFLGDGPTTTYHLASGAAAPLLAELMDTAGAPPIRYVGEKAFDLELARLRRANRDAAPSYDRIDTFIRMVAYPKVFRNEAAEAALGGPVARRDPLEAVRELFPELRRSVA
jgi:hypothetical protein